MSTSDKQIQANRRNALRSTGPRTPEGKRTVSRNALKHGILAREAVITGDGYSENQEEFTGLLARIHDHCAPQGPLEDLLVQQIAVCFWRLRRVLRADSLEFGKTLAELEKPPKTFEYFGTHVIHASSLPPVEKLDTILRYEKTVESRLYRALHHLDRLQSRRGGEPVSPTLLVQLSDDL